MHFKRAIPMQWNQYRVLVALPQGLDNSALVIAADRAGGLGILNGVGQGTRDRAIRRMRDFQVRSYAIRVGADDVCRDCLDSAGRILSGSLATDRGRRTAREASA